MEKFSVVFFIFISLSNLPNVYPDDNPGSNKNADTRQPVHIHGQCPPNQWSWPVKDNEWICDCANRFIYYEPTDTCYELYRQGPCRKNEYLVLPRGKTISECVRNPCTNDTTVPFNGNCHVLYKTEACVTKGGGTLNINPTTLELECVAATAAELNIIRVPNGSCPRGSKRSNDKSQCREIAKTG